MTQYTFAGLDGSGCSLAEIASTWSKDLSNRSIRSSFKAFEGNDHRLEFVANINNVIYINDSKATNINATWYSIGNFTNSIILIADSCMSKDKNFARLQKLINQKVKALILLGELEEEIEEELGSLTALIKGATIEETVHIAHQLSRKHDIVLLSPGCKSRIYRNYKERGKAFKSTVEFLAGIHNKLEKMAS